jgi:hypothetical protein
MGGEYGQNMVVNVRIPKAATKPATSVRSKEMKKENSAEKPWKRNRGDVSLSSRPRNDAASYLLTGDAGKSSKCFI